MEELLSKLIEEIQDMKTEINSLKQKVPEKKEKVNSNLPFTIKLNPVKINQLLFFNDFFQQ